MKIGWFSVDFRFDHIPDDPDRDRYTIGALCWYRMALPCWELAKHGYDSQLSYAIEPAIDGHFRVIDMDGNLHDDCDIVIFQRWMHEDCIEQIKRARASGQTVLQDVDDNLWSLPKGHRSARHLDARNSPSYNSEHYRAILSASDGIIASTPSLASAVSRFGPPTFVCRNAIDVDRWQQRDPGNGLVGWIGAIPWRANDLPLLRGIIGPFLAEHDLAFYHGGDLDEPGAQRAWEQLQIPIERMRTEPACMFDSYQDLWQHLAVLVVPLEDSTFNRGKSWLKGLEASASGIPFIASKLPEYEALGVGRLARPSEWRQHLEDLLDADVRRSEGAANRKRAEELSISNQWRLWAAVIDHFAKVQL